MELYRVSAGAMSIGQRVKPYSMKDSQYYNLAVMAVKAGTEAVRQLLLTDQLLSLRLNSPSPLASTIIEAVVESVRQANFPNMPSRLDSIFVFDQLLWAKNYVTVYCPQGTVYKCKVVRGNKIKVDMELVKHSINITQDPTAEMNNFSDRAKRFWQPQEPFVWPEIMVQGEVEIVGMA